MSGRIINVRSFAFLKTNELAAPTHSESHSPTDAKNPQTKESTGSKNWRKGWDLNPRYGITVYRISSPAHSTTLPPFRILNYRQVELIIIAEILFIS